MTEGQGHFGFGSYEMRKTLKGLVIAIAGSALAYFLTDVLPLFEKSIDPTYLFIVPLMSSVVNMAQLWIKNNEGK